MIAASLRDDAADDDAFELNGEVALTDEPSSELARQDSNLDNLDQNQVCYRYTTGQIDEPNSSAGDGNLSVRFAAQTAGSPATRNRSELPVPNQISRLALGAFDR